MFDGQQICVIGAGIIGLSTANQIQAAEPRANVTLIAEAFSPNVTSDVAAGRWRPIYLPDKRSQLIRKWSERTFHYVDQLAYEDGNGYGCSNQSGYEFADTPIANVEQIEGIVTNLRHLEKAEINQITRTDVYKHGIFYTNVQVTPERHLSYLLRNFIANGGVVKQRKIFDIRSLADTYNVIVNSTGLGSRQLLGDDQIGPTRGQVFRVKTPCLKQFYTFDHGQDSRYMFPTNDFVVVGGVAQPGNYNMEWDAVDGDVMWKDCIRLVPSLKAAKIIGKKVGLRPVRTQVRLESDVMQSSDGNVAHVVHNYGHGGCGWTLFHGCAVDAADLVKQAVHKPKAKI